MYMKITEGYPWEFRYFFKNCVQNYEGEINALGGI